jgi:hypothetical protein
MRSIKDKLKNTFLKDIIYKLNSTVFKDRGDNSYLYSKYSWDLTLDQRLGKLFNSDAKKIAYLMPKPAPDTPRYRAYNMAEILNSTSEYRASFFYDNELDSLLERAAEIDLLIMVRANWTSKLQALCDGVKAGGGKIAYDFDDLVFDIEKLPLLLKQINAPADAEGFYAYYVSTCYLAAKQAEAFITTNDFLGARIEAIFGKPVQVIPNFLNAKQVAKAKVVNSRPQASDELVIGYFSGTKTHDKDFALIADELAQLLDKYSKLKLKIVGHLVLPETMGKYSERIIRKGLQNYLDLEAEIASCTVNLVPLVVNEFTNCKSELKYFEAAIVNVPTVASPTFVFKQAIQDGMTGMLAEPGQWFTKVSQLLENTELRSMVANAANKHSLENYYGKKIADQVIKTISNLVR